MTDAKQRAKSIDSITVENLILENVKLSDFSHSKLCLMFSSGRVQKNLQMTVYKMIREDIDHLEYHKIDSLECLDPDVREIFEADLNEYLS